MNEVQKQITMYVVLGLVVLIVLYFTFSQVKNAINSIFTGEGKHQSVDPNDEPLTVVQSNLSYPAAQYDVWADSIYEALNYSGSNWTAVYGVIEQLRTNDDVVALINSYGSRPLYIFGIPSAPLNLAQAFTRESGLWNGTEDVNQILQRNGISFRF